MPSSNPGDESKKKALKRNGQRGAGLLRWSRITTDVISIRVPKSLLDEARKLALEKDASIAHVFREALSFYLKMEVEPEKHEFEQRKKMITALLADPDFRKVVMDLARK